MSTPAVEQPARLPFLDPQQTAIDGLGPVLGGHYRQCQTGTMATVTGVARRRYDWVTIRIHGVEQTIKTSTFLRIYEPTKPNGRP